jgi:NADH-quinone oxidoreductase subunit I
MLDYFKTVFNDSVGLLKGLGVTWKYMFQPKVTYKYPYQKPPLADRFRGMLTFHIEECIACDMCVRACPSSCIDLTSARNAAGKKIIETYTIDFGKCNWCRLCEEACPTNPKSVHHTMEYETMFLSRDDFKITWTKDAEGRPLVPVNAAGKPMGPWDDVPNKHLSVGMGAHKAPQPAAAPAGPVPAGSAVPPTPSH